MGEVTGTVYDKIVFDILTLFQRLNYLRIKVIIHKVSSHLDRTCAGNERADKNDERGVGHVVIVALPRVSLTGTNDCFSSSSS